jgi:hypothetical protein
MTTRTELIKGFRDQATKWDAATSMIFTATADMLEADELMRLANVDCKLHFDTLMADYVKIKEAARLALSVLQGCLDHPDAADAIAALEGSLK